MTLADQLTERLRAGIQDRYDLEREVGQGGMAIVFRALDRKHGRVVAIKVLRPDIGASLGAERFLSEIAICASLAHPHILPLYDSGEADGLLYYVMPFVEGESLRGRLERERQLPLADALHITRGVASALTFAHSRGIVHRDIKPENILLAGGEPVVADFGIARAISAAGAEPGARRTSAGFAVGTPAYMSPEQGAGDTEIDGRSDIYSLGCVLFEMLSGRLPFDGETALAITASKLMEPAPRITAVRETVSPQVEHALLKAMARVPADRYATAADFAKDLFRGSAPEARAVADQRSIAVLPFANTSGDPGDEFLSDGISEELIHSLGRLPGLHVVARTSAFAFRGKAEDIRSIGRQLNVGAILEGSVRRAGNRLRVTTRLVGVDDGYQMWSERYDRTLDDVFAVQDEIAGAVSEALKVTLLGGGAAPAARPASQPAFAAYELYLRGMHAWNRRSETALRQSVELLEQAVGKDAEFALAHAGLAGALATLGIYGIQPPKEVFPRAIGAAERALALQPDLPEALTVRGCIRAIYEWSWDAAEQDFARAIEVNPRYPMGRHWYAINCLAPRGRFAEARAQLEPARLFDPLSPTINVSLGLVSYFEGDHQRAMAEYRHVLEVDPQFGMAHYFMGQLLADERRFDEASDAFRTARELTGDNPETVAGLAHARALAGDEAEARRLEAELKERSLTRYIAAPLFALVRLGFGDAEGALSVLEEGETERATQLIWLNARPTFAPLKALEGFRALLERLHLNP